MVIINILHLAVQRGPRELIRKPPVELKAPLVEKRLLCIPFKPESFRLCFRSCMGFVHYCDHRSFITWLLIMMCCLWQGKPTQLVSRFRLTYSMILNLLRVEELRVEDMMKRSFAEFHMQKDSQERKREMEEVEKKLQTIKELDCTLCAEDLKLYFKDCRELSELTRTVQVMI